MNCFRKIPASRPWSNLFFDFIWYLCRHFILKRLGTFTYSGDSWPLSVLSLMRLISSYSLPDNDPREVISSYPLAFPTISLSSRLICSLTALLLKSTRARGFGFKKAFLSLVSKVWSRFQFPRTRSSSQVEEGAVLPGRPPRVETSLSWEMSVVERKKICPSVISYH